jgi:hypothetical protein
MEEEKAVGRECETQGDTYTAAQNPATIVGPLSSTKLKIAAAG